MTQIKKAYKEANESLEKQKIEKFKKMILATLQEIDRLETQVREYQRKIKILKMDIDDCKAGRLDKIKERQSKDPRAKEVSLIKVEEPENVKNAAIPTVFTVPYKYNVIWNIATYTDTSCNNNVMNDANSNFMSLTVDDRFVRTYTSGTYIVSQNNIKYI